MSRLATLLALLLAAGLLLAACGEDDDGGGGDQAAKETPTPEEKSQAGCEKVAQPEPKDASLDKPKSELDGSKRYTAVVDTSCGQFEIRLDAKRAPKTAGSFAYMARKGFYDDLTFHRIVQGFVIQGGDPKGEGTGGPGYSVVEAPPKNLTYTRGMVAMAKTDIEKRGTSGSQFFVVTEDADLPADYALVGKVSKGMDTVDRIAVVPTDPQKGDRPIDPVVIRSVKIEQR
jgi:peptidyl-prolyl cis-trans isomerase B (cyclophilin B)